MLLDWNPAQKLYFLRVPRSEGHDVWKLEQEHGLDLSVPASTAREAVLFTPEPFCAVSFWDYATPRAKENLKAVRDEIELSWAKAGSGHIDCPAGEELWPFQIADAQYILRRQHALDGDAPGLGKTPVAICVANEQRAKRVLVICPANIRLQWVKMIRRWSTMPWPYHVSAIITGSQGVHPTAAWTVVSYDLASTEAIGRALSRLRYDLLILDEGHYLKTIDTRRTRAIFGGGEDRKFDALATRAGSILTLTGTPLPNRPREIYTQARTLCWDAIDFMSEDHFKYRFNPSMTMMNEEGTPYIVEKSGRSGELQSRLRYHFMTRHEKHGEHGVMDQLKLPEYDIVHVELTGPVKQALRAESMLDIDPDTLEGADMATLGAIATVRRLMGVAIAPLAAEYVDMLIRGGEDKIVLFGHHIEVLDILEAKLRKHGVLRIDGRTPPTRKQTIIDQYIADPRIKVMLGNLQSMGTGTDGLQEVSCHAVLAEPDWVNGVNQQAVDRLDRGGQTRTVQADFLVAPGSFSERVLATALRKGRDIHKVLDRRV